MCCNTLHNKPAYQEVDSYCQTALSYLSVMLQVVVAVETAAVVERAVSIVSSALWLAFASVVVAAAACVAFVVRRRLALRCMLVVDRPVDCLSPGSRTS
jgi:hypothetical protein